MLLTIFRSIALFAAFLGTTAGFGISSILLPVALMFFDFPTSLALVSIFHLSGNVGRIVFFHRGIHRRMVATVGGASVLFTLLARALGIGGPIRGALLSAFQLSPQMYISTSGSISFLVDMIRVPTYLLNGFLQPRFYVYVPFLFLVAITGAVLSRQLVARTSSTVFRQFIRFAIGGVGFKLFVENLILLVS